LRRVFLKKHEADSGENISTITEQKQESVSSSKVLPNVSSSHAWFPPQPKMREQETYYGWLLV